MESVKLSCGGTTAEVSLFGGMTTAEFTVNNKNISPFYKNSWGGVSGLDPFTKNLKGDFFCLPFGIFPEKKLPEEWNGFEGEGKEKTYPHGYSANGIYRIEKQADENQATVSLLFNDGRIEKVERTVTVEEKRINFCDTVYAKRDFSAPAGFHPIFRLPQKTGSAFLKIPENDGIFTYPIPVDESSVFKTSAFSQSITEIPLNKGGTVNAAVLPLETNTEEVLFVGGIKKGECTLLNYEEGYSVTLEWERDLLPNCLLWLSNRGRKFSPWNGNNLCLGIEPVCSAFDLGEEISLSPNPLSKKGFMTSIKFSPEKPTVFKHSICVDLI